MRAEQKRTHVTRRRSENFEPGDEDRWTVAGCASPSVEQRERQNTVPKLSASVRSPVTDRVTLLARRFFEKMSPFDFLLLLMLLPGLHMMEDVQLIYRQAGFCTGC